MTLRLPVSLLITFLLIVSCRTPDTPLPDPSPDDWSSLTLSVDPQAGSAGSHANAAGWERRNAAFYHVWVSAFADSNADGTGDLRGVTQKVDSGYFDNLGINALWLSPVFKAASLAPGSANKHGYDTIDYDLVDPIYGTNADLENLLERSHARGLRVIFDFVPNHTSTLHPWFKDQSGKDWYVWRDPAPTGWNIWGGNPWHPGSYGSYYGIFWSGMPDLNYRNPAVRDEMASVVARWLNAGFDGLRIDAVKYLVEGNSYNQWKDQGETYLWFQALRRQVIDPYTALGSAKFMVAENWESDMDNLEAYLVKDGKPAFSMTFDFDWPNSIANNLTGSGSAGEKDALARGLIARPSRLPAGTTFGTFQSNHDNVISRPATAISGTDQGPRLFLAAALSILGKGTPFVYYGNEIGMTGTAGNDVNLRQPFDWSRASTQESDPASLWTWHSQLLKLRTSSPAWDDPQIAALTSPEGSLAFLIRGVGGQRAVIVANLRNTAVPSLEVAVPGNMSLAKTVLGAGEPSVGAGTLTFVSMPAWGIRVAALDEGAPFVARSTDADGSAYVPVPAVLFLRGTMNAWGTSPLVDSGSGVFRRSFAASSGSAVQFKFGSADWSTALGYAELAYDAAHDGSGGGLSSSLFSASVPDGNIVFTGLSGTSAYTAWIDTQASPGPSYWVSSP